MTFFCGPFLSVVVRFGISATIRTHQEIHCLPYAEFILLNVCPWFLLILDVKSDEICQKTLFTETKITDLQRMSHG